MEKMETTLTNRDRDIFLKIITMNRAPSKSLIEAVRLHKGCVVEYKDNFSFYLIALKYGFLAPRWVKDLWKYG